MAARSKRIGSNFLGDAKRRGITLEVTLPRPIPTNTTASMTQKAVEVDATYKRMNRNQITSRPRRMEPAPMLTKSRSQGGRSPNESRNRNRLGVCPAVTGFAPENSHAIPAAVQLMQPAVNPVPQSPHVR